MTKALSTAVVIRREAFMAKPAIESQKHLSVCFWCIMMLDHSLASVSLAEKPKTSISRLTRRYLRSVLDRENPSTTRYAYPIDCSETQVLRVEMAFRSEQRK